jgi:hypothetical protein
MPAADVMAPPHKAHYLLMFCNGMRVAPVLLTTGLTSRPQAWGPHGLKHRQQCFAFTPHCIEQ